MKMMNKSHRIDLKPRGAVLVRFRRFFYCRFPYYFALMFPLLAFFAFLGLLTVENIRITLSAFVQTIPAVIALLFAVTFFIEEQSQTALQQLEKYSPLGRNLGQKILKEYEWLLKQKFSEPVELKLIDNRIIELSVLIKKKALELKDLLKQPDIAIMPGLFSWLAGAPLTDRLLDEPEWDSFHSAIETYIRPIHTARRARGSIFKMSTFLGLLTTIFSIILLATVSELSFGVRIVGDLGICLGISTVMSWGLYVYDVMFFIVVYRPGFYEISFEEVSKYITSVHSNSDGN